MATSSKRAAQPAPRRRGPTVADDVQEAFVKPLKGMAERLQNLPLAGAASTIVESGRKDLQALMEANERSYQGLQAVVRARPRCSRPRSWTGRAR